MIDKILLFPYWLILKIRHFMYDNGLKKVHSADVPTICVGNVTVGGTGKTPHTEMLLRTLSQDVDWGARNIAVLSRGYKRKTKGFQQVVADGDAGDGLIPSNAVHRFGRNDRFFVFAQCIVDYFGVLPDFDGGCEDPGGSHQTDQHRQSQQNSQNFAHVHGFSSYE